MKTKEQTVKEIKTKMRTVLEALTTSEATMGEALQLLEQHRELAKTLYKDDEEVKQLVNTIEKIYNRL